MDPATLEVLSATNIGIGAILLYQVKMQSRTDTAIQEVATSVALSNQKQEYENQLLKHRLDKLEEK